MLNLELLSRIQFAFTISFHILFPAFSIGLALFLVILEGMWLNTKNPVYYQMCRFWIKVFALTFGMGVVSGVVMEFQLGSNWAGFTKQVGSVLGPLFVYEVMTAFFIEAGALGVMIFGWNKVGAKLHYFSSILVMLGTMVSAYWILSANSWMQHPVGVSFINGRFIVTDWDQVIFNPATLPRFLHMLVASYIAAFFAVLAISAYYIHKQKYLNFARTNFKFAAYALIILMPIQIGIGDWTGAKVDEYQPLKTAAIEAVWNTQNGAPLVLFGYPDQDKQLNRYTIKIPHGAALLNTHQYNGTLVGLKTVSKDNQPWVLPVFIGFRAMVGLGFIMLLVSIMAVYYAYQDQTRLPKQKYIFKLFSWCGPLGFLAIWFGWITAEIGRQPWVVYGLVKTKDAISPVSRHDVLVSLVLIVVVYGIVFGYFYFYFLDKTIKKGPEQVDGVDLETFGYMHRSIEKEGNK